MRRTSRTNRLHQGVVAGFAVALVTVGFSTPAHAGLWGTTDGFEYQPATIWQLYQSDAGGGGFNTNTGTAHSGTSSAWLSVQKGWSSVGRTLHITPVASGHSSSCAVQIYVQPFMPVTVNFEVIDPATWSYITLKTVTLPGGPYQAITSASFTPYSPDVYVRVSLLDSGSSSVKAVNVDDFTATCQYDY